MYNLLSYERSERKRNLIIKSLLTMSICMSVGLLIPVNAKDIVKPIGSSSQSSSNISVPKLLQSRDVSNVNDKCPYDTFANIGPTLEADSNIWPIIDSYLNKNGEHYWPDYWVNFQKGSSDTNKYSIPWEYKKGERKGIVFILPAGHYPIQHMMDYFASYAESDLKGPRIGLCSLPNVSADEQPVLDLYGATTKDNLSKSPLYISMAQVELYNVDINANKVDTNVSAIGLENGGKLILNNVAFTREDDAVEDTSNGLIDASGSYFSLHDSVLKRDSTHTPENAEGTMVSSYSGILRCSESELSVGAGVKAFTGFTNEVSFLQCNFNSLAEANLAAKPVFFYDNFDENSPEDCVLEDYTYCKKSTDPSQDYPPLGGIVCSKLIPMCDARTNQFDIRDNTFTGNWYSIFHSRWSSFLSQENNKFSRDAAGEEMGSYKFCADPDSFSVKGDFDFDNKICVSAAQW